MIVKQEIIDKLLSSVNEKKIARAMKYKKDGRVNIYKMEYKSSKNFTLFSKIVGKDEIYECKLEVGAGEIMHKRCTCADFSTNLNICKHLIATLLEFNENPKYARMLLLDVKKIDNENKNNVEKNIQQNAKYLDGLNLINRFYNRYNLKYDIYPSKEEKKTKTKTTTEVKIQPKIEMNLHGNIYCVSFKIGDKQLYKIKDLIEFADRINKKENYKYGLGLEFNHDIEKFDEKSKKYVNFILKNAEILKHIDENVLNVTSINNVNIKKDSINLLGEAMDDFFEIVNGDKVFFESQFGNMDLEFIDKNPKINFELLKSGTEEYKLATDIKNFYQIKGKEYQYALIDGAIYRCSKKIEDGAIFLLESFKQLKTKEILFNKKDIPTLFQIVIPNIKKTFNIEELKGTELEEYIPESLGVKVYLDIDKSSNIIMNVTYCYLDKEFNSLESKEEISKLNIRRNSLEERETRHLFLKTGFKENLKEKYYILKDDDDIYKFLTEEIEEYMEKFEVLVTEAFKEKQIITPRLGQIGVKVENNLLSLDFSNLDIDKEELQNIMKSYIIKKKYFRLKNGSYINLENNEDIKMLSNVSESMGVDFKDLQSKEIVMPIYRSIYLDKLLESTNTLKVKKEESFKTLVNKIENKDEEYMPVKPLDCILRSYQLTGYRWLKGLDSYNFGGILADDMGLGKTLQIISLITTYIKEETESKTSLIVCPSSLTLNWKNEFKKFAKDINVLVIKGKAAEREEQIKQIQNYDAVITSYDSLKRDIDIYSKENIVFKYIIADEAQYIKNSSTQNALALKKIKADTRFALTGTPIENSLSELWSIMDFVMPGYLYSYAKFKKNFEIPIIKDENTYQMERLRMLIRPFILRRLKKDVLTELPDKNITVVNNEMTKEQQKIYNAYLQSAKQEVIENIKQDGFEKNQIKILSLLTRLRQICCHPSLFIENYKGDSSKLIQCIELIEDAISSSHKILLFSQYTSMFELIEKYLEKENIKFFKLTGSTKVDERIKMVDDFNKDDSIKVFLISLKAGGTGLNLTGADVVIHYDPWWNISAENQATDRAYRIGQKNSVQVYKLITSNSIEEKIYELQERKASLTENMLNNEQTFITKLSKEDILSLFE